MPETSKMSMATYDPALVDFLLEHRVARAILRISVKLGSEKPEGWVKVPDILREFEQIEEFSKSKNLRSTVHYYCKRLYQKYGAIDRHKSKSNRPVYYRTTEKGKSHLTKIQSSMMRAQKGVG